MSWQYWAAKLDELLYTTDEGIEVQIRVRTDAWGYTSTVEGHPTKKGQRTEAYQAKRREYKDDWSFCWTGELPESLCAQVQ